MGHIRNSNLEDLVDEILRAIITSITFWKAFRALHGPM